MPPFRESPGTQRRGLDRGVFACAASAAILPAPRQDDAVPAVAIEEFQPLSDPGIEPRLHVVRNLAHDMLAVPQPRQLSPCRRRPHSLFTLFALISKRRHSGRFLRRIFNACGQDDV